MNEKRSVEGLGVMEIGVLQWWRNGVLGSHQANQPAKTKFKRLLHHSITPSLQFPITPPLHYSNPPGPNKKGTLSCVAQSARERIDKLGARAEDRVLGGFGHAELHHPLGRDVDLFASGR